jgi:hypothetical protein
MQDKDTVRSKRNTTIQLICDKHIDISTTVSVIKYLGLHVQVINIPYRGTDYCINETT